MITLRIFGTHHTWTRTCRITSDRLVTRIFDRMLQRGWSFSINYGRATRREARIWLLQECSVRIAVALARGKPILINGIPSNLLRQDTLVELHLVIQKTLRKHPWGLGLDDSLECLRISLGYH